MKYKNDEYLSEDLNIDTYTKEEIERMYYIHYSFNLKQLLQSNYVKFEFLKLKDLLLKPDSVKNHWHINTNNISLNQQKFNKLTLGRSIKKNGYYWPFVCYIDPITNEYISQYGKHRVYSLKLLQESKQELPNNFEIFSFIETEEFLNNFARDDDSSNFLFEKPITVYLNKDIVNKAKIKNRFINLTNVEDIDNFTIKADIDNMYDLWYACHSYSLYLRNFLIDYKIPSLEILNNLTKFKEWLEC